MPGSIFVLHDDGTLIEMEETPYDSEALLQRLLADYPNLLAGDQIDPDQPTRWMLVSREMRVTGDEGAERGSLDHLFLDQDAVPTLVEVKRSRNTQIRREVVGQMLDYAANGVAFWSVDEASFFADLQAKHPAAVPVARRILEWGKTKVGNIVRGEGTQSGSFVPIFRRKGTDHQLFAVFTYGRFETFFQHYLNKPPFSSEALRVDKLNRLNAIPGVSLAADSIARRPSFPLESLLEEGRTEALLGVYEWVLEQIRTA